MIDLVAELRILMPKGENPDTQRALREIEDKINEIARKVNVLIDVYNDRPES